MLKEHRLFQPPQIPDQPAAGVEEEDEDEEDDDEEEDTPLVSGGDDDDASATAGVPAVATPPGRQTVATATVTSTESHKRHSRGGDGKDTTAKKAALEQHRSKKLKAMQDMVKLQEQRQSDFQSFVVNYCRAQAFDMASMCFNAFNRVDERQAAHWRKAMVDIVQHDTPADVIQATVEATGGEAV